MSRETVGLTKEENQRARVLSTASPSGRTNKEVAQALGLSIRQVQRLKKTLRAEGPTGLAHGSRGTRARHALPEELTAQVAKMNRAPADKKLVSGLQLQPLSREAY